MVSEIDDGVVRIDRERLGLRPQPGIDVRTEDGRLGLRRLDTDTLDLVVGDAFGGVSVPWHLTTVEALTEVRRVLAPDGLYVANLIDHDEQSFAKAELATLRTVFAHVALLGEPVDTGLARTGAPRAAISSPSPPTAPPTWPPSRRRSTPAAPAGRRSPETPSPPGSPTPPSSPTTTPPSTSFSSPTPHSAEARRRRGMLSLLSKTTLPTCLYREGDGPAGRVGPEERRIMRKLVYTGFMSLDGVVDSPGGGPGRSTAAAAGCSRTWSSSRRPGP